MRLPSLALLILLALLPIVGCAPTHTTGTAGKPKSELAVLSIQQLPSASPVKIQAVQFDNEGDSFPMKRGRSFYLLPGTHTATFTFEAAVPGIGGWFVDPMTFTGPSGIPLGTFEAKKTYELAPNVHGFAKMMKDGKLSLVREKTK